jgi:serine kinase of HPr protein (carbohydrate metabolism regulator)
MMTNNAISVRSLIKKFNFEILYKGSRNNKILIPSLNRTGIELVAGKGVYGNIISAVL